MPKVGRTAHGTTITTHQVGERAKSIMYCVNELCVNFGVWDNTSVLSRGTSDGARRYYCKECGLQFKDRYRVYVIPAPKRAYQYKKRKDNGKIWCYCPKCERNHWALLDWAGRGIPRRFCETCRWHMSERNMMDDEQTYNIYVPSEARAAWTQATA